MDEKTREEFLRLLAQCDPKTRKTTMGAVGDRVSTDKVSYVKEEMSFVEPDLTTREVTFVESAVCDCGKLITLKNPLKGVCQHRACNRYVCSECSRVCCRCGRTVCSHHSKRYQDSEIYCNRCRPVKWLQIFFDIGGKEKEK